LPLSDNFVGDVAEEFGVFVGNGVCLEPLLREVSSRNSIAQMIGAVSDERVCTAGRNSNVSVSLAYVRDLLLRLHADDPRLEEMLPDRWAAAHPEAILNHRLEESRTKAIRTRARRAHRRAWI